MMDTFFLGTHQPAWLASAGVPLFVSQRRLAGRKSFPRAIAEWALDSGGFSELSLFGAWRTSPVQYAQDVKRYMEEIGSLRFAAIQDWMVEPAIRERTGLSVAEHQTRTVHSFLELRDLAPEVPWMPVIQGWSPWDYLRHVNAYSEAGVELRQLPAVGVGSVCRRQAMLKAGIILELLRDEGLLNLHGFGFKLGGLRSYGHLLKSADSMAWSFEARKQARMSQLYGLTPGSGANSMRAALEWREYLLSSLAA